MSRNLAVVLIAAWTTSLAACAADAADPQSGDDAAHVATTSAALSDLPTGVTAHAVAQGTDAVLTLSGGADPAALAGPDAQLISPRFSVVLSFLNSCIVNGSTVTVRSDGAVTRASSPGCTRFNGTTSSNPVFNGVCTTNVSNCNGAIVCQSHCP